MKKEEEKMKDEVLSFFKEAFCIDGEAELMTDFNNYQITGVIKMTDSKRGVFYVGNMERKI